MTSVDIKAKCKALGISFDDVASARRSLDDLFLKFRKENGRPPTRDEVGSLIFPRVGGPALRAYIVYHGLQRRYRRFVTGDGRLRDEPLAADGGV